MHRRVDGELLIVRAQSISLRVVVAEQPRLEHRVCGRLDAGNEMRGGDGQLFDFGEVVLGIAVERYASDWSERHFAVRPDFGHVEDVPPELLCILRVKNLDLEVPTGIVATFDCVEEILGVPVGVHGGEVFGFFVGEGLVALVLRFVSQCHSQSGT